MQTNLKLCKCLYFAYILQRFVFQIGQIYAFNIDLFNADKCPISVSI